jgi:hypothetical protein
MNNLKAIRLVALAGFLVFGLYANIVAQDYGKQTTPTASKQMGAAQTLTARLIDPEKKAKEKTATVEVTVGGVALTDPAKVGEKPIKGEGHLHYRVDDGPVIATTATKLSFHELTPGVHKILIVLAANNHTPLGPQETLTVTIP